MRVAKMFPLPGQPTEAERARHDVTHMPKAKGKDRDHKRLDQDRAISQLDYSYLKSDG